MTQFYKMPTGIMGRTDITSTDKLLYALISGLGTCYASNRWLAEQIGAGDEKSIRRSLKRLEAVGLVVKLDKQGKRTCYRAVPCETTNNSVKMTENSVKMTETFGQNDREHSVEMTENNRGYNREINRVSEYAPRTHLERLKKIQKFQSSWSLSIGASAKILEQLESVLDAEKIDNYLDFALDPTNEASVGKLIGVAEKESRNIDYFLADNISRMRGLR